MFRWLWRGSKADGDGTLAFRQKYASFRRLLGRNTELLNLFSELEVGLRHETLADPHLRETVQRILATSLDLVQDLNDLTGGRAGDLFAAHQRIEALVRTRLKEESDRPAEPFTCLLDEPEALKRECSGGKAANLAELRRLLPRQVPAGFVVTTAAYRYLAQAIGLSARMHALLATTEGGEAVLAERASELRRLIAGATLPAEISEGIAAAASRFPDSQDWAVRSSGVGEDGQLSFAGQFDSCLGVPCEGLLEAYRTVIVSRFSDRALAYRQGAGLAEVETPMAVLFLPMVVAEAAGVLYTADPQNPGATTMWLSSTFGLGLEIVAGTASSDLFIVDRERVGEVLERHIAQKDSAVLSTRGTSGISTRSLPEPRRRAPSLSDTSIRELAELGLAVERHFGEPQDIEWARDEEGHVWVLQARPLPVSPARGRDRARPPHPVKLQGRPVSPGRAVGTVYRASEAARLDAVPEGAVLVVAQATPEVARVLGQVAAIIAVAGSPQSHAASLMRQAGVPAVFGAADAVRELRDGEAVGVDGTRGEVYAGIPWPELRGRTRRSGRARPPGGTNFVSDLILRLDLVDPDAASFEAQHCKSIHDLLRLAHERALAAMFRLGDRHVRWGRRGARHLKTEIPIDLEVLDLGGGLAEDLDAAGPLTPASIVSVPFRALWRGIADPAVRWAGRREVSATGFLSVLEHTLLEDGRGLRRLGDRNYLVVARDYLNLNARLAYHYAMLDAVVGEPADSNYVTFRFQGGGASLERRDLRAQFLAQVLGALAFGTDRRGDLLNAWLRGAPRETCEAALTQLGLLMACARQLDMLLPDVQTVRALVDSFLAEDYGRFA
jgi:pyruvate,water dikinase